MESLKKGIILFVLLSIGIAGGFYWGYKKQFFAQKEEESAQLMLEKISKVFKMVAVEGQVAEIYDYEAYKYWDIGLFRKKIFVRVKAKVSIGYDFDNVNFDIDEEARTITIRPFPEPEILSIDHDLDYYDMQEGVFNEFSEDDLNKVNKKAKDYTISLLEKGELFQQAENQKDEILSLLSDIFHKTGWTLQTQENISPFRN